MTESKKKYEFATDTAALDLKEMEALAADYDVKWDDYEAKKKIASEAHAAFTAVEDKIQDALENAQKTSYKANTGMFTVQTTPTVLVAKTAEDKSKLFDYLKKLGDDVFMGLVSVNSQTINSWYKKVKEEAGNPPGFKIPGVVESDDRKTLRFTAAKKGK
jgi:hypothetical protein